MPSLCVDVDGFMMCFISFRAGVSVKRYGGEPHTMDFLYTFGMAMKRALTLPVSLPRSTSASWRVD